MTRDAPLVGSTARVGTGLGFAVLSAMTFGMSGTMAKGLLVSGWTPAAAVTARIGPSTRVIELRGGNGKTHVHLDRIEGEPG